MPEGITSIAEAFAAAEAEMEATPSVEAAEEVLSSPAEVEADAEQADEIHSEQLDSTSNVEELFTEEDIAEEVGADESAVDLEVLLVEVPGEDEPKSVAELRDGYLRQADYTKKTQEEAARRTESADAIAFWERIQESPIEVVTALAAKLELIPAGSAPTIELEVSPYKTASEVEEEISRRVEEAVGQHPEVVKAHEFASVQSVNASLDALAEEYEVELGPQSRRAILMKAQQDGTTNLETVYLALVASKARRESNSKSLSLASGQKGARSGTSKTGEPAPKAPDNIREAWAAAEAALAEAG